MNEHVKIPCSVQVLTLNSAKTLVQCLESVKDFAEIIVLDGNSTDETLAIARQYGARLYPQTDTGEQNVRVDDFAALRNRGLALAKFEWFLYVDSDEYLSPEVVSEIRDIIARGTESQHLVYQLPRHYVRNGKILRGLKPSYQTRFFHRPAVSGFIKRVHERIQIKEGVIIGNLKNPEYVPLEDIDVLKAKWSRYIDMQTVDLKIIPKTLFLKTRANLVKFFKYLIKYVFILIVNPGQRLPFWHEYHNAMYHLKLVWRLWLRYFKLY